MQMETPLVKYTLTKIIDMKLGFYNYESKYQWRLILPKKNEHDFCRKYAVKADFKNKQQNAKKENIV